MLQFRVPVLKYLSIKMGVRVDTDPVFSVEIINGVTAASLNEQHVDQLSFLRDLQYSSLLLLLLSPMKTKTPPSV